MSPTVLIIDGFRLQIFTSDHLPAHVHIFKGGGWAKIAVGDGRNKPYVMLSEGLTSKEIRKALQICLEYRFFLIGEWRKIHD